MYGIEIYPEPGAASQPPAGTSGEHLTYWNWNNRPRKRVIGDDYVNYVFHSKQTVKLTQRARDEPVRYTNLFNLDTLLSGNRADREVRITLPSASALIAVGETPYPVLITQYLPGNTVVIRAVTGVDVTLTFYIFNKVPISGESGYGLCAYNPQGEKTFSSDRKYLRITEVNNYPESLSSSDGAYRISLIPSDQGNDLTGCYVAGKLTRTMVLQQKLNYGIQKALLLDAPDFVAAKLPHMTEGETLCMCITASYILRDYVYTVFDFMSGGVFPKHKNWPNVIQALAPAVYQLRPKIILDVTGF